MKRNGNSLEPIAPSRYSWEELENGFLPKKMAELAQAIKQPFSADDFAKTGTGLLALQQKYPRVTGDCSGCYVLIENGNPLYVGISREVYKRLFLLLKESYRYSSTLANMMANHEVPMDGAWYDKLQNPVFKSAYEKALDRVKKFMVAVVPVGGNMELYIFAAYCAQHLGIPMINLFRTN